MDLAELLQLAKNTVARPGEEGVAIHLKCSRNHVRFQ